MDVVRFKQLVKHLEGMQENAKVGRMSLSFGIHLKQTTTTLPLADLLFLNLSKLQTKWIFLPSLGSKEHRLTMGQKRNNNNHANKHQEFDTILSTFLGSSTCWVVIMDILLLLFINVILQLLLLMGGKTFSYMSNYTLRWIKNGR